MQSYVLGGRFTLTGALCLAATAALTQSALASFHMMQIEQVTLSLDGDNTVQAIQLRMRSSFQNQMQFGRLVVRDATGSNPITLINFSHSVTNSSTGTRILVASPNFAAHCTPAAAPDFIMTNLVPASYLAAGKLSFEFQASGTPTTYWSLSWGGSSYTGSQTGDFTNDSNGNFGPAVAGPFPTAGTSALKFTGSATAPSTTNLADYAKVSSNVMFTNSNGASFLLVAPPPPRCIADYNNDGGIDGADVQAFFNEWEAGNSNADVNDDGGVDGADVAVFFQHWQAGTC